jgi:hypothetical protein
MANPKELITRPPPPDDAMIPSWNQTASIPPPAAPPVPLPASHGSHSRTASFKYAQSGPQSQSYSSGQHHASQSGPYQHGYSSSAGSYSQMSYQYGASPGYYGYDMPSGQPWSAGSSYPAPHSTYKSRGAPSTSTYGFTPQAPSEPPTQNAMMGVFRANDPHEHSSHGHYPAGSHSAAGSRQSTMLPHPSTVTPGPPPPATIANPADASRSSGASAQTPAPARTAPKSGRAAAAPILPGSSKPTTSPSIVIPPSVERASVTPASTSTDRNQPSSPATEAPSPPWAAGAAVTDSVAAPSAQPASKVSAIATAALPNVDVDSSSSSTSAGPSTQDGPLTSPWSTWESHRLRHLVESSQGHQGAKKGHVDWEWVFNQWGPTRTRYTLLLM